MIVIVSCFPSTTGIVVENGQKFMEETFRDDSGWKDNFNFHNGAFWLAFENSSS